mgnify:CR=1 FL=1
MGYGSSEQQQTSNNDFEYSISESNKIATTNQSEQELMQSKQEIEFTKSYRNKNVTIHLEFSEQSNQKAADDFFSRLKELYMKKVENRSMQLKESALQCMSTKEKEDRNDG